MCAVCCACLCRADRHGRSMLRDFIINEHILGKNGVGNGDIDGLFIDGEPSVVT